MRKPFAFLLLVCVFACACLGASDTLTNRTGAAASGVIVTFSQKVTIEGYDRLTFASQAPASGKATRFTFDGGILANGGRFAIRWQPDDAEVVKVEWEQAEETSLPGANADPRAESPKGATASATPPPSGGDVAVGFVTNLFDYPCDSVSFRFAEPVRITAWDEAIMPVLGSKGNMSYYFTGGLLNPGASFWCAWIPKEAVPWTKSASRRTAQPDPVDIHHPPASLLNPPGNQGSGESDGESPAESEPAEPLYQPKSTEYFWLTDEEGHAAIHADDAIKINYSPLVSVESITRIEVYRNGEPMTFLPLTFEILTNEWMKAFFDAAGSAIGDPSSDIAGFVFEIRLFTGTGVLAKTLTVTVEP